MPANKLQVSAKRWLKQFRESPIHAVQNWVDQAVALTRENDHRQLSSITKWWLHEEVRTWTPPDQSLWSLDDTEDYGLLGISMISYSDGDLDLLRRGIHLCRQAHQAYLRFNDVEGAQTAKVHMASGHIKSATSMSTEALALVSSTAERSEAVEILVDAAERELNLADELFAELQPPTGGNGYVGRMANSLKGQFGVALATVDRLRQILIQRE